MVNKLQKSAYVIFAKTVFTCAVMLLLPAISVLAQSTAHQDFFTHFKTSEEAEGAVASFGNKLDLYHILNLVANRTGATKTEMDTFSDYYTDTLFNDRTNYFNALGNSIQTNADINKYALSLVDKYVVMFQKLKQHVKQNPDFIAEYKALRTHKPQSTCNPGFVGFESGTLNGWNAYYASNNSTATKMTYTNVVGGAAGSVTQAAYDGVINKYHTDSTYQVKVMSSGEGNDPIAGALIPVVAPAGGNYSCRLGDTSVAGSRVAILDQAFTVTAATTNLTYSYAALVDEPAYNTPHAFGQQPHFIVTITDQTTGDTIACGQYLVGSKPTGINYFYVSYTIPSYKWADTILVAPWTNVYVPLQNYIGHCIDIQAIASDCYPTSIGAHFCYVYFNAKCDQRSVVSSTPPICGGTEYLTAPSGGSAYAWAGPCITGDSANQTISATCSGTYTASVTTANGCIDTLQQIVTINAAPSLSTTSTNATCNTCSNGSATVTIYGGYKDTIAWSDSVSGNTYTALGNHTADTINNLLPGTYVCTVTDSCGNIITDTIRISAPAPTGIQNIHTTDGIRIYPTPNDGHFTITCNGLGYNSLAIFDETGKKVYSTLLNEKSVNSVLNIDLSMCSEGVYLTQINSSTGLKNGKIIIMRR